VPDSMEGQSLPEFDLESTEGKRVKPADLRGSWVVLYFYPKDETSGCTAEACSFTASLGMFTKLNAKIYGISADSIQSHQKFIQKNGLKFPLLADVKKDLARALGASTNAKLLPRLLGFPARDTFLIDPQGKIVKVWRDVDPDKTVNQAYEELKLQAAK